MTILPEQLVRARLCDRATADGVYEALNFACARFGIKEPVQVAAFLAQCAHESCGFKATAENLNYSAQGLLRVFAKRVSGYDAPKLEHKPEDIANHVYSNRMGNGPKASGDGWRFRGRGFIQLTGRNNYTAFAKDLGDNEVLNNPDIVSTPKYAALSAAWFWEKNGLNATATDVVATTKKVNGGTVGLEERKKLFESAKSVFCA